MIRLGFGVTVLARCLATGGVDGIGSYTRELLKRYSADEELRLLPISFGYKPPKEIATESLQHGRFAPAAAISAVSGLPFLGTKVLGQKIDLMHATDHLIPNLGKTPVVATIMDAIPLSHPEMVAMKLQTIKTALWKRSAHWARHVVTISEYSKQDIVQHFGVSAAKITVIPLGVDERWFSPVSSEAMNLTLHHYGLPEQFFLFVGTLQPRKNIARVIEAYRSLPQGVKNHRPLVIVGRAGWQCEDIVDALSSGQYGPSILWLKHLPDEDLRVLVKAAAALVFPSLYEGFGLPVLEAFASGTPVITSNTTSLPEVAGDAAVLVDPLDTGSIADAMSRLINEPALAKSLQAKGYARAKLHTWDRTARMTQDVYQRVLAGL